MNSDKERPLVVIVCRRRGVGVSFAKFLAESSGAKYIRSNRSEVITELSNYVVATSGHTNSLRGHNFRMIIAEESLLKVCKEELQRDLLPGCPKGLLAYYEMDLRVYGLAV